MILRHFLFLQRRAPLAAGPEAFDLPLTAAAFDQDVTLLLLDDGVYWLTKGLPELVTEAIDMILVERESLLDRGLGDLTLPDFLQLRDRDAVITLIDGADRVIGL